MQMSALKAVGKPGQEEDVAQVHRIRITLTSRNVKNLEKGAQQPLPDSPAYFSTSQPRQMPSALLLCPEF